MLYHSKTKQTLYCFSNDKKKKIGYNVNKKMKNRERTRKLLITHRLHAQLSYHAKKEEKKNKTKFVDGGRDLSVGERAL